MSRCCCDGRRPGGRYSTTSAFSPAASKPVHSGQIKQKDLCKIIGWISTVPTDTIDRFGVDLGHAFDRMRDLAPRAILARLCPAADRDALWPFAGDTPVEAILADDAQPAAWRPHWHERLDELDVGHAVGPPRSAVDFSSEEDR